MPKKFSPKYTPFGKTTIFKGTSTKSNTTKSKNRLDDIKKTIKQDPHKG